MNLPKRLIEVDLPIARISAHARREKSIRHGHISTLHIWWARRPLAACRAVICAALWPDPADENCPQVFRDAAAKHLVAFAKRVNPIGINDEKRHLQDHASPESLARWEVFAKNKPSLDPTDSAHQNVLRFALLDFIADFANWDNSTVPAYLETSRALTQAAHEALGGEPGTRPLVVDPFAGGGSIPLEALRVGADAFASDLNPVAVLLNKVVLEYIPKYGQKLADEVRKWGAWIKEQAEKELAEFYPKDPDGATPIAYLWARTIRCEGAGCGAEVPLMRSLWLAKKANESVALRIVPNLQEKRVDLEIVNDAKAKEVGEGTVKRGSATCPCCGFTTPVKNVREQLAKLEHRDRLFAKLVSPPMRPKTEFRFPTATDFSALERAKTKLHQLMSSEDSRLIPSELVSRKPHSVNRLPMYGIEKWGDAFGPRQQLAMVAYTKLASSISNADNDPSTQAASILLGTTISKMSDYMSTLCIWRTARSCVAHTFGRQALPFTWDYGEMNPFAGSAGDLAEGLEYLQLLIEHVAGSINELAQVHQSDSTIQYLPDGCDLSRAPFTRRFAARLG